MIGCQNPILRGFNPDPSIVRVGQDYYIATSTFEWFPGIQIHHSTDLSNWALISRPLDSKDLLDMKGVPDSCGVWAPCLSHDNGKFYLVYTNVKSFDGPWKDTPNFLATADDIYGPWSDPILLASYGFDGSLFHDSDGRKWYLSLTVDHRRSKFFGGIVIQEFSEKEGRLVGPVVNIFEGTSLGITEGPHLYKRDGYYYLVTAEGGTEYGHAVSIARSKDIFGPYEIHPNNPLISSRDDPGHPLQKCGHGDFVWNEKDECFMVFLVGRPLSTMGICTLGRETAIEQIQWELNEWPILADGHRLPRKVISDLAGNTLSHHQDEHLDFSKDGLSIHYQSLRIPMDKSWIRKSDSGESLQIIGRESLTSTHNQSLIARRIQHFEFEYTCKLSFDPLSYHHLCGLVVYYNTGHYYYLHASGGEKYGSLCINVIECNNFITKELVQDSIILEAPTIIFKVKGSRAELTFYYGQDEEDLTQIEKTGDWSILSDDYVREGSDRYRPAFTGSFVGVACQDLTGMGRSCEVLSLYYKPIN